MCWSISSIVRLKTLTPPSSVGLSGCRASLRTSCGTWAKAGFCAQLRVVVGRAEDVGELGEDGVAVDALEGRREVAEVAPDDGPGVDVVLGPAGRDRGRGRRGRGAAGRPRPDGRGGGRRLAGGSPLGSGVRGGGLGVGATGVGPAGCAAPACSAASAGGDRPPPARRRRAGSRVGVSGHDRGAVRAGRPAAVRDPWTDGGGRAALEADGTSGRPAGRGRITLVAGGRGARPTCDAGASASPMAGGLHCGR